MNYQECNVVMLPTEKATDGGVIKIVGKCVGNNIGDLIIANRAKQGNKIFDAGADSSFCKGICQPQHLYITNPNEEIKEGDWFYDKYANQVFQVNEHHVIAKWWCKIIATTDESLGLPRPSNEFLKKFCKLGGINKVMVWYNIPYGDEVGHPMHWGQIEKIKSKPIISSNNTISIKPVKENWNRREVIELFEKLQYEMAQQIIGNRGKNRIIPVDWVKENI